MLEVECHVASKGHTHGKVFWSIIEINCNYSVCLPFFKNEMNEGSLLAACLDPHRRPDLVLPLTFPS